MDRDHLLLVSRICLSAVFLYSGLDKAVNWGNGLAEVSGLGLPFPAVALALTIVTQLAGGLMLLLGVYARFGAFLLLGFTVVATLLAHNPLGLSGGELRRQLTTSLEHLAIVGGFLLVLAHGAGRIALDRLRTGYRMQRPV
jgi:putative oxidoreductase